MSKELSRVTIDNLKAKGFRVFMKPGPQTWCYISDKTGARLAYVQAGYFGGLDVSTCHKPDKKNGTGFRVFEGAGLDYLTKERLESAFNFHPDWARGGEAKKWSGISELIEKDHFLRDMVEV